MNWKALWKTIAHAALGGASVGLAAYTGGSITVKTVLFPALASAFTSVISLFSKRPTDTPTAPEKTFSRN